MNGSDFLQPQFDTVQQRALTVGGIGAALMLVGVLISPQQFYQSYLLGYILWVGLALGCLGILLLHHLVSGAWGHLIQRMVEAGARTLPFMALLFIPVLLGMEYLYPWTRHDVVEASHVLHEKEGYLNVPFFIIRAAIYFCFWIGGAYLLSAWSRKQDSTADPSLTRRMRMFSGPGLVLFGFSLTFASVDWMMSLEPEWYSTIYGMQMIVGSVLTALAFCIVCIYLLSSKKPYSEILTTRHLHHLGNLLFAFTILWAYLAFSQYLIIWSGNLPEDNFWYVRRLGTGWNMIAIVLLLGHFFVPFLLLLSRRRKRAMQSLARIAAGLFLMRLLDIFWLISPAFNTDHVRLHWLDFVAPVAIGGLWIGLFVRDMKGQPLLPKHDPRFTAKAEYAHH